MKKGITYVGLDVHAGTIAVAVAESGRRGEVRSLGKVPNRPESIRKLVKKLGPVDRLRACYEAGPTGYALYWQLEALGVRCEVVAPTLVPVRAGDRVKTDRRDAEKLARSYRAGELTAVWVPDRAHEALRDLVRAREAAKADERRAAQRLSKFLLRLGLRPPKPMGIRTKGYLEWARKLEMAEPAHREVLVDFVHEFERQRERIERLENKIDDAIEQAPEATRAVVAGLQALRGVAKIAAVTLAVEVGRFSRFEKPRQLMGYSGAVPSELSSGESIRRGGITKTGNGRLRKIVTECSWAYRFRPQTGYRLKKRQEKLDPETKAIAWRAQHRLHDRYRRLCARGKPPAKAITAVGREFLAFAWEIGVHIEKQHQAGRSPSAVA